MYVVTIITKKSVREVNPDRRKARFYTSKTWQPGDMIEIIDGNKKSPALVMTIDDLKSYKQALRGGNLEIKALKLSKSGDYAGGVVIEHCDFTEAKKYYKDPKLAQNSQSAALKKFFPRKQTKRTTPTKAAKVESIADLSADRYTKKSKSHSTELQLFVDEVRTYFHEDARYGQGSFPYYLGFCKKIPMTDLWQMFGEAKQSKKNNFDKKKLFWWKIGQYLRKD